jgi:hypothetical protein
MLLGVTGDQVLPLEIYNDIKVEDFNTSSWNSSNRYFERRS